MLVPLAAATADRCGAKAATLATLLRHDLPVPDGVVVPFGTGDEFVDELARWLEGVGDPAVAVRSSAANEDTPLASAAGQHDSFLGVQGIAAVVDAVRACRASVRSARATAYRQGAEVPPMAVIVQRHLDADASGVMFTGPDGDAVIEASWGLGPSTVEGRITPDRYEITTGSVTRTIADKPTALHRDSSRLVTRAVPAGRRRTPTLSDETAVHLADLGQQIANLLGAPQDIEWALTADHLWFLQTRPITAELPPSGNPRSATLTGTPGSHGTATGPARIVRGPSDFPTVRPGDILICPLTDPAWTPLLSIAAGVVTETGGILSHAAIIARERGIPAVLAVPNATTQIPNGTTTTIHGTTGAIHLHPVS
ncbi:PEP/pyruvate-binding domain-containing protein [Kribbella shirazensis]|uniref:Pyruvate,water dikinase n=1 Tax=Kribbella shirazensis TaxID=1105143 RepID=A0A7X5VIE1_9ACTN|nr:PEP/pyruvate-binding domain-containing protein [Kribbella shirazensis]NIK61768.1 pyruvate,water dikinase [Kribbella shirazensis]